MYNKVIIISYDDRVSAGLAKSLYNKKEIAIKKGPGIPDEIVFTIGQSEVCLCDMHVWTFHVVDCDGAIRKMCHHHHQGGIGKLLISAPFRSISPDQFTKLLSSAKNEDENVCILVVGQGITDRDEMFNDRHNIEAVERGILFYCSVYDIMLRINQYNNFIFSYCKNSSTKASSDALKLVSNLHLEYICDGNHVRDFLLGQCELSQKSSECLFFKEAFNALKSVDFCEKNSPFEVFKRLKDDYLGPSAGDVFFKILFRQR